MNLPHSTFTPLPFYNVRITLYSLSYQLFHTQEQGLILIICVYLYRLVEIGTNGNAIISLTALSNYNTIV